MTAWIKSLVYVLPILVLTMPSIHSTWIDVARGWIGGLDTISLTGAVALYLGVLSFFDRMNEKPYRKDQDSWAGTEKSALLSLFLIDISLAVFAVWYLFSESGVWLHESAVFSSPFLWVSGAVALIGIYGMFRWASGLLVFFISILDR